MDANSRDDPDPAPDPDAVTDQAPREVALLTASGAAAVGVAIWVFWQSMGASWQLAVPACFAVLFVVAAMDRIRRPGSHFGDVAVWLMLILNVITLVLFPYQVTLILAVVLAASAPYHLSPRVSWLMLVTANVLFLLILNRHDRLAGDLPGVLSLLALQAFAISSSLARRREEDARVALAARNAELQAARAELARQSQAEERLRIAGALHDSLGHRLTALQLQLEVLRQEAPPALRERVAGCKKLAIDLLEEVRAIVRRMPESEHVDLRAALDELQRATPGVVLSVTAALPEVATPLAQQLVFCFQEAVHNAVRHGGAERIEIQPYCDGFLIDDNGAGLREGTRYAGFGLRNMNQRLAVFGGSARLETGPAGAGCRLRLSVPLGSA